MASMLEQINEILKYNSVLPPENKEEFDCQDILNKWKTNKRIINKFLGLNEDNNWILNLGQIELHPTAEEKAKLFSNCLDSFVNLTADLSLDLENYMSLNSLWSQLRQITPDEFFNNQLKETYSDKLVKGTKIIRDFKYFIKDAELLEMFQQKASDFIQKDKLSGEFCISTNPLDFLSVSENTLNWRSCHNLRGLFCGGGLSYMVDPSSVVVYIKTNSDVQLPDGILWNNKKWRMMLHFSERLDMVFGGRPYPFYSQAALDMVGSSLTKVNKIQWSNMHTGFKYLSQFMNDKFELHEPKNFYDYRKVVNCGYRLVYPAEVIHTDADSLNYDDLRETSFPEQLSYGWNRDLFAATYWNNKDKNYEPNFLIGDGVPCPRCGKKHITPLFEKGFVCIDCAIETIAGGRCDKCGRPLNEHNIIIQSSSYTDEFDQTINEDKFLCLDCAAEEEDFDNNGEGYDC